MTPWVVAIFRGKKGESIAKSIEFDGKKYPVKYVYGNLVSTKSLDEAIMTNDGEYVSEEARKTDEQIVFFVPDAMIRKSHEPHA